MRKAITLLFLLVCIQTFAQSYPVTGIIISLPANPDANTANWSGGNSMLSITASSRLINGRIDGQVSESKILVFIKSGGSKICGIYTGNTAPSANFNSVAKSWGGTNAVSLLGKDCILPPGDYELCVQFFGAGAAGATPLSEEKSKTFSIRGNEPQMNPIIGITISLPQNPDANTANWQSGISMLGVTASTKMNNGKIDGRVTESRILITIKNSGSKICGIYSGNTAPSANFNSVVKTWIGNNAVSLLGKDCVLPPGDYELCVQFFGAGPVGTVPLSEEKSKAFSIRGDEQQSYQAPQLIAPANETVFSETEIKQPITLRWIPVVPRPRDPVTYRVRIWQLMEGQNGTQVMKTNQPIITKDVDNLTQTIINNLVSTPCVPPYLCEFIWTVQAITREEKILAGASEPARFSVKGCNVDLKLKLKSVECIAGTTTNPKYRICVSATYAGSVHDLTYANTGSGFTAYDRSRSSVYPVSMIKPGLQVQKGGPATTVDYCFEVSLSAGQTSLKIFLQGDNKNSGRMVCKASAELDVKLPKCNTCNCGAWKPLMVQSPKGVLQYECGNKILIPWKCNKPFKFESAYQCNPSDAICEAKTNWEIKKDGVRFKTGSGINGVSDGFTPTSNGTYTLILNASCNGIKCTPCIYTVVVEDCNQNPCEDFKVNIEKSGKTSESEACCFNINITNNNGSNAANTPYGFRLSANNTIISASGSGTGWNKLPSIIQSGTKTITYKKMAEAIPVGQSKLGSICFRETSGEPFYIRYEWLDAKGKVICKDSALVTCDSSTLDLSGCDIDIDSTILTVACGGVVSVKPLIDGTPSTIKYTIYDSVGNIILTASNIPQYDFTLPGYGVYYGLVEVSCGGGDANGGDEDEEAFEIINSAPVADFVLESKCDCVAGSSQRTITTLDNSNEDGVLSYAWKVKDLTTGNTTLYNVAEPTYILSADKKYSVELTVQDQQGCSSYKSVMVDSVVSCTAKYDWWYSWCTPCVNDSSNVSVNFSNMSEFANCALTAKYLWNFGDGDTSNAKDPIHTYKQVPCAGTSYTVTLTLTLGNIGDPDYCTTTWDTVITINNQKPIIDVGAICCDGLVFFYTDAVKGKWSTPGSMNRPKWPAVSKKIWKPLFIQVGQSYRQYYSSPGTYYVSINGAQSEDHNRCPASRVEFTIGNIECFNRNVKTKGTATVGGVDVKYKFRATALPLIHRMKSKIKTIGRKKTAEISTHLSGQVNKQGPDGCFCTPQNVAASSGIKYDKRKAKTGTATSGKFRVGMDKVKANFYIKTKNGTTATYELSLGYPPCDHPWFLFF